MRTRRGFYVILAQVSKRYTGSPNLKRYGRGFWEIVPARHFPALATLAARVRGFNPASHFPDYWKSGRYMRGEKHYWYQLAVSGDVVRLHQDAGCSGVQGIMEILDHARRRQHLSEVHTDYTSLGVRMRMPLLHVQAVDNYFHLTNARLAWAAGDGRAEISNPFIGQRLLLDSSNILSPRRHVSTILRYLPRAYRRPGSE